MKVLKRMMGVLLVLAACVTILPMAQAENVETIASGYCGSEGDGTNLTWKIDSAGVLTISGEGEMLNFEKTNLIPWYSYRQDIKSIAIEYGVTNIGEQAFYACTELETIRIPNTITHIGAYSFYCCENLKMIVLPESIKSVDIYAFTACSSLTTITIPETIESIGGNAFLGCNSLQYNEYGHAYYLGNERSPYAVLIKAVNTNISECIMHKDAKVLADAAFIDCNQLENVVISSGISKISIATFVRCSSLASLIIPVNVVSFEDQIFLSCDKLSNIYFEGTVAQWEAIIKEEYWDMGFSDYTVNCLDGKVLNHAWDDAPCTERRTCTVCDLVEEEARGHSIVINEAVPASCESEGWTERRFCGECRKILIASVAIPSLGHADSNLDKICDNCGRGLVVMVQSQNNSVSYHTKITKAWKSIPNDGTETKVTLLNDIVFSGDDEYSAGLVINQKQNVVLYGGSYSITYEGWCECIDNKGTLTIQSGTISANTNTVSTSGTTIINGGKIISGPYGNALFNDGVLIINGADTRIENQSECVLNFGKLIINDGAIVGKNAGIINAGEMEIHNGDIFASVDADGIGIVFDRGSVVIDGGTVYGAVSIESLYMSDDGWLILSDSPVIAGEKNGIRLTNTIKLSISDKLLSTVSFFMEEYSDGYVVASGTNGYSITEADAAKLIPTDDGYRCYLENGSVVLRKHVHEYASNVTMPTCTEEGYTTYSCNCGDTYTDDRINALGHDTVNHEEQDPVCTEKGWDAYVTCTRCDYTTYVEKGALGHSYVEPAFVWAEDLSFVSASMPCENCDHIAVSKTADISWVIGQGKLTAFVAVAMNGKAYTSITEITSAVSGNEIMVALPDNVRNVVIFAASYSDNGTLCTCTSAPVIDGTATLSISGSNVKLFFLSTNGYRPLTPYMTIKK